jgi:UDP-N-acetylmuramyl pentapeptide phosphotransferase/UDP-N-acetylglucosamine-1-phosphate transferase
MLPTGLNMTPNLTYWLLLIGGSIIISALIMPLIIKLNTWLNCFDVPDARKIHKTKIATMGGLGIYVTLLAVYLLSGIYSLPAYFWFSLTVLVITGVFDDVFGLRWYVKLLFQAIAAFILIYLGFNYSVLFEQIGLTFIPAFLQPVLLVFLIILYINAFNLIDGLDGLAGGLATINFLAFGILNYHFGNFPLSWLSFVLVGGLIGFLIFNMHPAKIFMGDTGSLTLGFLLIVVAFNTYQFHHHIPELNITEKHLFIWVISGILILPFADAVRVFFTRLAHKQAPYYPGKDHVHHLLLKSGFSQRDTALILYGVNVLFLLTGLVIYLNKPISIIISVLLFKM